MIHPLFVTGTVRLTVYCVPYSIDHMLESLLTFVIVVIVAFLPNVTLCERSPLLMLNQLACYCS